jgi:transcription elongation GreA/GreB family factor
MHPDLEKLVEAGKINTAVAERLDQLAPGSFLLHSSWGAGKVTGWDLPSKKLTIDFENRDGQEMDLQFALQKTKPLEPDDFRSKKVEEIENLRELATTDPVALVVYMLESHGGTMSVDGMEKQVSGAIIPEDKFKKWWEKTKRALRDSKRVVVPSRRTEALTLRAGDLSPAEALLEDFQEARDLKSMAKALEAIAADASIFRKDPESLSALMDEIHEAALKGTKLQLGESLDLMVLRDELVGSIKNLVLADDAPRLANLLLVEESRLHEVVGQLPAARQRSLFAVFPEAFGDRWVEVITSMLDHVGTRGVAEIAKLITEHGKLDELQKHLQALLSQRSLGTDALIWVSRERKNLAKGVFGPEVGAAVLNRLETDHLADGPRTTTRLQSLLSDDKTLLSDIVEGMSVTEARNFGRRLLECPVFGDLDRKSLMARIIKARPETGELVSGESSKRSETLVVSWESLERKKAELEDLVRNRIPQNTKDIAIARSYGDLRENFEYKSAKDMQKVLMRRKGELQQEIDQARGSDLKGADTSTVNIGTIVTIKTADGREVTYTVLGAWDSDPEKNIVSYMSETGAAMLGAKPGEEIQVRNHDNDELETWTIETITAFNP